MRQPWRYTTSRTISSRFTACCESVQPWLRVSQSANPRCFDHCVVCCHDCTDQRLHRNDSDCLHWRFDGLAHKVAGRTACHQLRTSESAWATRRQQRSSRGLKLQRDGFYRTGFFGHLAGTLERCCRETSQVRCFECRVCSNSGHILDDRHLSSAAMLRHRDSLGTNPVSNISDSCLQIL